MPEHRPFPPSPRRLALARQAGLHAASPALVAALACGAGIAAVCAFARAAAVTLGAWLAAACAGRPGALAPAAVARAVVELAAPVVAACALAAALAHLAQTRVLWLPRRRIDGAPSVAPARTTRAAGELAAAAAIGAACFAWLWWAAPRLAALLDAPALAPAAVLVASLACTLAATWAVAGGIDALARHVALGRALAMTPAEKRADDRLAAADPRWRARRAELAREPSPQAAVAGAALVLVGDGVAQAIAWDPVRQPVPLRTAGGRGARATQLVALARRYRVPVHRDVRLAGELDGDGPVPERAWARLAEIIAAVRERR